MNKWTYDVTAALNKMNKELDLSNARNYSQHELHVHCTCMQCRTALPRNCPKDPVLSDGTETSPLSVVLKLKSTMSRRPVRLKSNLKLPE